MKLNPFKLNPGNFLTICITAPQPWDDEVNRIVGILRDKEADIVHLRHPGLTESQTESILRAIPEDLRARITLHDHHSLVAKRLAGGIHLNSRNKVLPSGIDTDLRISASCHSLREIEEYTPAINSYVTLSPIFDSISKHGYCSAFILSELSEILPQLKTPVIALGGVTPERIPALVSAGFRGAAMLGYFLKN